MNHTSTSLGDPGPALTRLLGMRRITPASVARLRASELGFGLRTVEQAAALLAVERRGAEACREWSEFLVETLLDFLVWDERPVGRLDDGKARWLCDQVGDRPSPACMALMVAVLDEAVDVPAWFPDAVVTRARASIKRPEPAWDHAAA